MSIKRIKELINVLNDCRDAYYNKQEPIMSDYEYDCLFDELKKLEETTGVAFANSPTQSVGYEVVSELPKIHHSHPMLSLDKTKDVNDLKKFAKDKQCIMSLKLDGLTVLLTYDNGELVQAETRGNGEIGEIITHNAKVFENIPLKINYKGRLEIEGEAIITFHDFNKINESVSNENKFRDPRNLVSGSVRRLDSSIAAKRHIKFIAWKVPSDINDSFLERLIFVRDLGFDIVPLLTYSNNSSDKDNINLMIKSLRNYADEIGYPIDGLVMTYDDINYGISLGSTGHHPKHSVAFKFYDEEVETKVKYIDWTMGKTGVLTPTVVFDPVEIDGTIVERASVHNISILYELGLLEGDVITVFKANAIIPQVANNLSSELRRYNKEVELIPVPNKCPICGCDTYTKKDNNTYVLMCSNDECKGKLLGTLSHFVSKNAINIEGLSDATLEKFIELGWVKSFADIYELENSHKKEIEKLEGFGKKSADKLFKAIDKSKDTTLDKFIYALSIPLIGKSASKTLAKTFDYDFSSFYKKGCLRYYTFEDLEDFGTAMSESVRCYMNDHVIEMKKLSTYFTFNIINTDDNNNNLHGKTFVITGSLSLFKNREELKNKIESCGGKVTGSVSNKTSYLINNDLESTSSKNKKAKELNVPIITEEDFVKLL